MSAYTQADTLEDEVDNYLASQDESVDIIKFWQVSRDGLLCWGILIVVEMAEAPEPVANTLQACHRLHPHSSNFSAMWACLLIKQGDN